MKNDLLTIGPFTIHGYGLMIGIGVMAAYWVSELRMKKRNMDYEKLFNIAVWCLLGGILGAKLLYYMTRIEDIPSNPSILWDFGDGFVVYGGILGGILAGFLYAKKEKLDFLKHFDVIIPSVALAQGFGRIGCLLAGCCYGRETSSPLGMVFHTSEFAPNGVRLVPTQLISSGLNFLNFFALLFLSRYLKADGQVAGLYLIFYSAGRFVLEFYRGDLIRGSVGTLSTSQFISIFTFLLGIAIFIAAGMRRNAGRQGKAEAKITKEAD